MGANAAKERAAEAVRDAKERAGLTWVAIAEKLGKPKEWTVAALLGQHPLTEADAGTVGQLLGLDDETVRDLQRPPYRTGLGDSANDPTIYRFHEALAVYGPAIKELIAEEFGDGIMSASAGRIRPVTGSSSPLTGSSSTTSGDRPPPHLTRGGRLT